METQHRKGRLTGTCDLSSGDVIAWGGSWEIYISLTCSFSLLLGHSDGQIQPEARGQESLLMQFLLGTNRRGNVHLERKEKKGNIQHSYHEDCSDLPRSETNNLEDCFGVSPTTTWTTTYTNRFLDEILVTSTSSIFAETEKASFSAQIVSIRLPLAKSNRKPD